MIAKSGETLYVVCNKENEDDYAQALLSRIDEYMEDFGGSDWAGAAGSTSVGDDPLARAPATSARSPAGVWSEGRRRSNTLIPSSVLD